MLGGDLLEIEKIGFNFYKSWKLLLMIRLKLNRRMFIFLLDFKVY